MGWSVEAVEDFRKDYGMDAEGQVVDACAKIMRKRIAAYVRWWNSLPWYRRAALTVCGRVAVPATRLARTYREARWTAYRLLFPVKRALLR